MVELTDLGTGMKIVSEEFMYIMRGRGHLVKNRPFSCLRISQNWKSLLFIRWYSFRNFLFFQAFRKRNCRDSLYFSETTSSWYLVDTWYFLDKQSWFNVLRNVIHQKSILLWDGNATCILLLKHLQPSQCVLPCLRQMHVDLDLIYSSTEHRRRSTRSDTTSTAWRCSFTPNKQSAKSHYAMRKAVLLMAKEWSSSIISCLPGREDEQGSTHWIQFLGSLNPLLSETLERFYF